MVALCRSSYPEAVYLHYHGYEEVDASRPATVKDVASSYTQDDPVGLADHISEYFSPEVNQLITKETRGQASNPEWIAHRTGRITASVAHRVKHYKHGDSLLKEILGQSSFTGNKHTEYGLQSEPVAKAHYSMLMKTHKNFKLTDTGLIVSEELPFLAASPDGLVSCSCHGAGLLEIKSSSKHRDLSIDDICRLGNYHMKHDENSKMQLKTSSPCFTQIQFQLGITGYTYCDFVAYTQKAPYIAVERILFDREMWEDDKAVYLHFFQEHVAPSLFLKVNQIFL